MSNARCGGKPSRVRMLIGVLGWLGYLWVLGCSPADIGPGTDGNGALEVGTEKILQDSLVQGESAKESLEGTDSLGESSGESSGDAADSVDRDNMDGVHESVGSDVSESSSVEKSGGEGHSMEGLKPEEVATQDVHVVEVTEMTPESTTQESHAQDNTPTMCESIGGYCDFGVGPCKSGYQIASDPRGCPGGRSALCCEKQTSSCKAHCDCQQGLMCVLQGGLGTCIAATKPVWCCDKSGCPTGEKCTDSSGNAGTCPAAATDCEKKGGYCSIQGKACSSGYQVSSDSCGPILSKMCCLPTTKQCKVDCDCSQGLLCANGQCIAGFAPAWCCDKSGCPKNQRCTDSNGNAGMCP